jgi:hypothetical protein
MPSLYGFTDGTLAIGIAKQSQLRSCHTRPIAEIGLLNQLAFRPAGGRLSRMRFSELVACRTAAIPA